VLLSTTLKNYRDTLVDNIFKSNALWYLLKERGAFKELDGGERIVVPLMYGKNSTAKSYSGYDLLDTTPQTGIDAAEYNWKQYSVSITISGEEERKNAGSKTRIINLLDAKTKQAKLSIVEALGEGTFSDGTANDSKQLTGLKAMVAASGTYGGIASGTYTWWQAYVSDASEALDKADMVTAFNSASVGGNDLPNIIVTTQTLFEKYEAMLSYVSVSTTTLGSITTNAEGSKKLGDLGFQTLNFKGAPVVFDELCTSTYMYFLNTNHMNLTVHKDANFKVTDFVKPEDQDARVAQILFMGNFTCDRRKSFGLLSGRT
jgi:imidazoleglycerol phosphate synthase glutamine amidotransferase subunit HisH